MKYVNVMFSSHCLSSGSLLSFYTCLYAGAAVLRFLHIEFVCGELYSVKRNKFKTRKPCFPVHLCNHLCMGPQATHLYLFPSFYQWPGHKRDFPSAQVQYRLLLLVCFGARTGASKCTATLGARGK